MNRKLTLSINGDVIDAAKEKATEMELSLSSWITELLLQAINKDTPKNKKRKKHSKIIEELAGCLDLNHPNIKNDEYAQYLLRKHR